jgi:DNA primase
MKYPESFLDELKYRMPMPELAAQYVTLKAAGRDFTCLCPFHSEKSPSCHIYEDHFYCYGCGAGGDTINFIRLIERLDFSEAVAFLAQKCGLDLPQATAEQDEHANQRKRMLEMNRQAARFFRDVLLSEGGKPGRDYLQGRGLTANTLRKYGLGYAPDSWDALKIHMNHLGYGNQELFEASLLSRSNSGSYYDKFRGRVMFPIIDWRGDVVGFGGRLLGDGKPKYLNSAETPVFSKKNNLFSLNFAKNAKDKTLLLCEGYMDVISLNQAGFDSAVATLGTAITPEHARLFQRYAGDGGKLIVAYDADAAGQNASVKVINLLDSVGVNEYILRMKNAKDPDEFVQKFGADAFAALMRDAQPSTDWLLERIAAKYDPDSAEGTAAFRREAVELLAGLDKIERADSYAVTVAQRCRLPVKTILDAIADRKNKGRKKAKRDEQDKLIHTPGMSGRERAERVIIAYLLRGDFTGKIFSLTSSENFDGLYKNVYDWIKDRQDRGERFFAGEIGSALNPHDMGKIEEIRQECAVEAFTEVRLDFCIGRLKHGKPLASSQERALERLNTFFKDSG